MQKAFFNGADNKYMGLNKWRYNDSEDLLRTPFTLDEIDDIIKNFDKNFTRDDRKVEHLLIRVSATCRTLRELKSNIETEISRRTAQLGTNSGNIFYSPEKALEFLSPEQIEVIFDNYKKTQLEAIKTVRSNAEADMLVAKISIEAFENLFKELSMDFNLPNDLLEKVAKAIEIAKDAPNHKPDWSGPNQ